MSRLKEIKGRLQSVQSTRKITSAMMMVSSAKQKKAERVILNLRPYTRAIQSILQPLLVKEEGQVDPSPYMVERKVERVAIVAFSSNSGLVGRFNNNVADKLMETINQYQSLGKENIIVYPVGEKVAKEARKKGITTCDDFLKHAEKPTYANACDISKPLMDLFARGEIDRVELIYHHYRSTRSQLLRHETFLPINFSNLEKKETTKKSSNEIDYILEPDKKTLLDLLVPKVLQLKLHTAHVDSVTSEHAARVIAMQIATDNADELIDELRLEYNKMRQQAITNELLDIMGGTVGHR